MVAATVALTATVSALERVSSTVVRVDLDTAVPVGFLPGQYVHLTVPGTEAKRSYSFANSPGVSQKHSFYVKLIEGGVMSTWVGNRWLPALMRLARNTSPSANGNSNAAHFT